MGRRKDVQRGNLIPPTNYIPSLTSGSDDSLIHLLNTYWMSIHSPQTAGFAMPSGEGRVSRQSAQWQSGSTEDSATSLSEERIRARPQPKSKPTPSVESHSSAWKASLGLTRQPHHRLSAPEAQSDLVNWNHCDSCPALAPTWVFISLHLSPDWECGHVWYLRHDCCMHLHSQNHLLSHSY